MTVSLFVIVILLRGKVSLENAAFIEIFLLNGQKLASRERFQILERFTKMNLNGYERQLQCDLPLTFLVQETIIR